MSDTRDTILARLNRADDAVSGDLLAAELGLSRAGIWKHIQALKNRGVQIESISGKGYRLVSDELSAAALTEAFRNRRIGHHCTVVDEIDSTNREMMRLAESGEQEGLILFARQQSGGRGRLGRSWHTAPGDALALSILLRPPLPPEIVPQLSLMTAVAVQQACARFAPQVRIKWPNDLLFNGAKIAGILTEMRGEPGRVHAVVIGIGINLRKPDGGWPDSINQKVGDLSSAGGRRIRQQDVAATLIEAFNDCYETFLREGFAPIRQLWWQNHAASGQKVRVHDGSGYIEGIAEALDSDGALLLRCGSERRRIIAGDLELLS